MAHGSIYRNTIQSEKIHALLLAAHGAWVALPEILALGIAQYNARIWQLRHECGLTIENKTELGDDGIRRSWFRLVPKSPEPRPTEPDSPKPAAGDDWYERQTGQSRPHSSSANLGPLFGNQGAES